MLLQRLNDKRQQNLANEFAQKYDPEYPSIESSTELDLELKGDDVLRRREQRVKTRKVDLQILGNA